MYPFRPECVRIVDMTPEQATKILAGCKYEGQRTRNTKHVDYLSNIMLSNDFKPCTIELCHCMETDADYLTDGQHRLESIVQTQTTQTMIIIDWEVPCEVDVDKLYAATDGGRIRSIRDRLHVLIHNDDINKGDAAILSSAVAFIANGFSRKSAGDYSSNAERRASYVRQWIGEWRDIQTAIAGAVSAINATIDRTSVLSVFLVTMRYQPEQTKKFLRLVANNDGLAKHSPEWQFVNTIVTRKVQNGREQEYARWVAAIWNAYFRGETLSKLFARDARLSILISGTPYKG